MHAKIKEFNAYLVTNMGFGPSNSPKSGGRRSMDSGNNVCSATMTEAARLKTPSCDLQNVTI
jgi:hypothetical protein